MISRKNKIRGHIRSWLLRHPKLNPYEISHRDILKEMTSPLRMNPNFFILGASKSGTTSLYDYVTQHPLILQASQKEIYYFDEGFEKGFSWYRSHFPINSKLANKKIITGEANPNYLYHPLTPTRLHEKLPDAKLIIILRNPVDRAYSDYRMKVRWGVEKLSFEDAIMAEEKRKAGTREQIEKDRRYSYTFKIFFYLNRGLYIDQLKRWFGLFPKKQILVSSTEELDSCPRTTLKGIFDFLKLPDCKTINLKKKTLETMQR